MGEFSSSERDFPNIVLSKEKVRVRPPMLFFMKPGTPEGERLFTMSEAADRRRVNNEYFWNMLVHYVEQAGFNPPIGRSIKVLEIGCGLAAQSAVLRNYFSGSDAPDNFKTQTPATYVGVDNVPHFIKVAITSNKQYEDDDSWEDPLLPQQMSFVVGDATDLSKLKEVPEQVDVTLFRHPRIVEAAELDMHKKIFEQALARLSETGILFITFHSKAELDVFEADILPKLEARVLVPGQQNTEQDYKKSGLKLAELEENKNVNNDNYLIVLGKRIQG